MIHVVLASDENYVQHMAVAMVSLLHNCGSTSSVSLTVINNDMCSLSKERLSDIAGRYDAAITFVDIENEVFNNLHTSPRFTRASYYRLLAPDILPEDVEKFIYLDSDLIVRHDISELWETDISHYYLGAVYDIGICQPAYRLALDPDCLKAAYDTGIYRTEYLGLPAGDLYFNSGVLLINTSKWREFGIREKVLQYAAQNRVYDQDALNAVLWGKWRALDPKWNVYRLLFRQYYRCTCHVDLPNCYFETLRNPSIVHFTGDIKPWHYACCQPFVSEYYDYLSLTPWKGFRPTDIGVNAVAARLRWIIKKSILDRIRPWIR